MSYWLPTSKAGGFLLKMSESTSVPLVCTLAAGESRQRREEVQRLFDRSIATRELDHGVEFTFPGEEPLISELSEFIRFERNCCRFLTFELVCEPDQGPLHLRILGAPEAKQIIREMFSREDA